MPEVTADMTITLDGYGSGRNQSAEHPFGDLDENRLHAWQFEHRDDNTDEANAITAAGASPAAESGCSPTQRAWS